MPYSSNGEKASFLLFGFDCCHSTEAVVLPKKSLNAAKVMDYQEKLVLSLSSVKALQWNQSSKYNRTKKISMIDILTVASSMWKIRYYK